MIVEELIEKLKTFNPKNRVISLFDCKPFLNPNAGQAWISLQEDGKIFWSHPSVSKDAEEVIVIS